jgi:type IV pilus assembly protein PilE
MGPFHRSLRPGPARSRGFTLIELLVAVAIVAILAAIAVPGYREFVLRAHRTAAQSAMMDLAVRQQQYLLAHRRYADATDLTGAGYAPDAKVAEFYDWDVDLPGGSALGYTITFTPKGTQAADGALTLDSAGNRTPAEKW